MAAFHPPGEVGAHPTGISDRDPCPCLFELLSDIVCGVIVGQCLTGRHSRGAGRKAVWTLEQCHQGILLQDRDAFPFHTTTPRTSGNSGMQSLLREMLSAVIERRRNDHKSPRYVRVSPSTCDGNAENPVIFFEQLPPGATGYKRESSTPTGSEPALMSPDDREIRSLRRGGDLLTDGVSRTLHHPEMHPGQVFSNNAQSQQLGARKDDDD